MSDEYQCPYCEESFDSPKSLGGHKRWNHDLPWEDKDNLKELYVDEQLSIPEIADKWDAGTTTIEEWLEKHGIDTRDRGGKPDDAAYKDPERLRELYRHEDLSRKAIAERLDCTVGDVRYQLEKHGIEKKSKPWHDEALLREKCEQENIPVPELADEWACGETTIYYQLYKHDIERPKFAQEHGYSHRSYSDIYHRENGESHYILIHRLVAYAHGKIPANEVYNGDLHIHHKSGVIWDNSPENLQAVTNSEHQRIHAENQSE